jgi:hypothetical protein
MERNIQRTGLINLLTLLIAGVGGFAAARYSASLAGMVAVVFTGLGVLVCAVSWFQMRLEESERQEKMELDELLKSHSSSAMFESRESEVFPPNVHENNSKGFSYRFSQFCYAFCNQEVLLCFGAG